MSDRTPPPEPFIRPEWGAMGKNTPFALTNPLALFLWGTAVTLAGIAAPFALISAMPTRETPAVAFAAVLGVVIAGLGLLTLYAGWRRRAWEIEYEKVMGYKPGKAPR